MVTLLRQEPVPLVPFHKDFKISCKGTTFLLFLQLFRATFCTNIKNKLTILA